MHNQNNLDSRSLQELVLIQDQIEYMVNELITEESVEKLNTSRDIFVRCKLRQNQRDIVEAILNKESNYAS